MRALWQVELFGGLCLQQTEQRITRFPTRKTAVLLAYLALHHDKVHSREGLIEMIWPDCDAGSGRNRLSTLLVFLRHVLEPPGIPTGTILQADRMTVRLNSAGISTDVAEFERLLTAAQQVDNSAENVPLLERAVALYKGELLAGYYEEWIVQEQIRLAERYVDALQQLGAGLERQGAFEAALEVVQRALQADPYREETHRSCMRLNAALGRPNAALEAYRTLEQLFEEDLGLTPSPATRQLADLLQRNPDQIVHRPPHPRRKSGGAKPQEEKPHRKGPPAPSHPDAGPAFPQLPLQLTRFFGRQEELEQLQWLLCPAGREGARGQSCVPSARLVTLTGPPGSGKTRLAIEAAMRLANVFCNRVWFVPLADLTEVRRLPEAIGRSLQLAPAPNTGMVEQVMQALASQPSLLVLDNFEHLIAREAISPSADIESTQGVLLIRLLLERVPGLACLVTSRQALHLGGEREFPVSALPLPEQPGTPERLLEFGSVALYTDRAQAVRPDFALTSNNAAAVAELCRKLEGMPLAIEMAAAWAKTLPPARMLERMEKQLDLLASRQRDLPPRRRSLRATIDWSYNLLSTELQRFFARLSVFRGGWTLEAAEEICKDEVGRSDGKAEELLSDAASILHCSSLLVEQSLVVVKERGETVRYQLLEALREYASERLVKQGENERMRRRHAGYFLALAEQADANLRGPDTRVWLDRLEAEHDNLRAAQEWYLQDEAGAEACLRLAGALGWFWLVRGYLVEGRERLMAALSRAGAQHPTAIRAKALNGAGNLACQQGDHRTARALYEESLAIQRGLGNRGSVARGLNNLGNLAYLQGDYEAARALYEESLTIQRELGDKEGIALAQANLGNVAKDRGDYTTAHALYSATLQMARDLGERQRIANALNNLGLVAQDQGSYETARLLFEESLALRRELGDRGGIALAQANLGLLACRVDDHAAARAGLTECLILLRQVGDRRLVAEALDGCATLAVAQGQVERAARLLGAEEVLREAFGAPMLPRVREEYDRKVLSVHQTLGAETFARSWAQGRAMDIAQAIEHALASLLP